MRKLTAEALGTFSLVFAGTGAIVVNQMSGGAVTHVGVSLTFGLVVLAMIYSLGDISGAHLNPAVTIGFWLSRRFPGREVPSYVASQCTGALAASITLRVLFPENHTLGATQPATRRLPVLLDPLVTASVLGVLSSAFNGESALKGRSLFLDRVGDVVQRDGAIYVVA